MSSIEVLDPSVKVGQNQKTFIKMANINNPKRKSKHDRGSRKRSKSFSGCGNILNQKPVLPTKFLLGGNIKDPLNLNSLQDEEINRAMNAVTPKSSPVPTPPRKKGQLEVIIPRNIHDPLNLIDCPDDATYEQQLCSPLKKGRKKRLKKRRTMSATMDAADADVSANSEAKTPETSTDSAKIPDVPENYITSSSTKSGALICAITDPDKCEASGNKPKSKDLNVDLFFKKDKTKRKADDYGHVPKKFKNSMDKIVSPVVPQPGAWLKRSNSVNKWVNKPRLNKTQEEAKPMPQFKEKAKLFQYGNYNRYYGYRNPNNEIDHRLKVFLHHSYLFKNKDILDIGCNIGHITLSVARDFSARSVLGIDIDQKLVSIARKNIKHYVKTTESPRPDETQIAKIQSNSKSSEFFPISMPILYGAIDIPGFHDTHNTRGFPNNVTFKQCNYVLEDENFLNLEQAQFDTILCLSVTKWIHLNWGDPGIKQAFRRMYAQLRPGGKLILELQNWASYKSKKKLTETIYRNYNAIEFFPEKFREYLLSPAVGFAKSEILGFPSSFSRGFRRPIQVFTKSTMFPSERVEATPSGITPNIGVYNDVMYHQICKTNKYESHHPGECVEHVYTDIIDTRYCGCSEEISQANEDIAREFQQNKVVGGSEAATDVRQSDPANADAISRTWEAEKNEECTKTNHVMELKNKENISGDNT